MSKDTFFEDKNIPIATQPNIGLDAAARQSVVEILNLLLADEAVLLLKMHRVGEPPDLKPLFETQRKQINNIVIEITERVRILGGSPLSSSDESINSARLDGKLTGIPGIINILADHEAFIRFLREDTRKCYEAYDDQGTFAILVSIIRLHEKMAWVLRSNIKHEPVRGESQKKILKKTWMNN